MALPPASPSLDTLPSSDILRNDAPLPHHQTHGSLPQNPQREHLRSLEASQSVLHSAIDSPPSPPSARPTSTPVVAPCKPEQRFARPLSVDSPTLYEFASPARLLRHSYESPAEPLDADTGTPEDRTYIPAASDSHGLLDVLSGYDDLISEPSGSVYDASRDGDVDEDDEDGLELPHNRNLLPPPMFASRSIAPNLTLDKVDTAVAQRQHQSNPESPSPESARHSRPPPKSPSQASPFTSLFGWGNPSPSVTDFSSIPSPVSPTRSRSTDEAHKSSKNPDPNAAEADPLDYCEAYLSTPPPPLALPLPLPPPPPPPPPPQASSSIQVEEMEEELKAISSELAASIRREMDLEDLVDRLQEQVSNPQGAGKRTSDYFSDSGNSSAKLSEYEQSREEVDKVQRRAEQEKASIRLELTTKLQDERSKRKVLDQQIKDLAEKASQIDLAQINNLDANSRVRDLETTCEDLRRRLSEERESKDNFGDLLSALKGELHDACNERDNLRDEVVPQLRARVEGLESEAAAYTNLTYESTKMQQQLQSLQQENTSLRGSSGANIPEDWRSLTRSNSTAAASFRPRGPPGGLARSDSVKNAQAESRDQLFERLKDVEAQRDALHSALKNLLERQEFQNRENRKKIEVLEGERRRLLSESPKKAGFERDIANLRTEINVLRRRAEDALEQKWQVEKGLVGLKMDLDRAEEEIASLRSLLKENDILTPPPVARPGSASGTPAVPVTSESLERAYRELQDAYRESLDRIKSLEASGGVISDEKTRLAMQRLEQSLSSAVSERDAAQQQVSNFRNQVGSLTDVESRSIQREKQLADELSESAQRVEQLAAEVRQQLSKNAELRERLTSTVARGDAERKANSDRISGLQERLHALEEQLVAAQTASEDRVGRHEEEIAHLRESHNEQLRRLNNGTGSARGSKTKSHLLRSESPKMFGRSGQVMPAKSFEDEAQVNELRERVTELEKALADAETEIQLVVAKMSTAQIEVMNLQEEREAAVRETRQLMKTISDEQLKSFKDRFQTLNSMVG
ncbi:hypothetical protein L249_3511 [Ophiocordyceps polyrhachis-furcata BCC 54312]|uniref:DUF7603 domain-containing protein n=1 Tax=Ophiocordyceps polyrhachis-furcata BCC 54312 TaxID=1330021 RepID=A0A367LM62_9HYPO|nr:hypothetical protein L249_3511 [Ophiocordyceps polyrhachis-furcata BCC 54312]